MQRAATPLSTLLLRQAPPPACSTLLFSTTAADLPLSEEDIHRIRAAKASRRGGQRGVSRRQPHAEDQVLAPGGRSGRGFHGGWRPRQPLTEDQVKERLAARQAQRTPRDSGEEAKHRGGRFGRFQGRGQQLTEEQLRAFAAARGREYRGMGRDAPFADKFAGMEPPQVQEWMKQREAVHEAFRAASPDKAGRQDAAGASSSHHGGRRGGRGRFHHARR